MINQSVYEKMKNEYGKYASWTIWAEVGDKPKSNTGLMTWTQDVDLLSKLNTKYVFVGLNWSQGAIGNGPWTNFHSDLPTQNDYKLRYALKNTEYWGSYITDIIKKHREPKSEKISRLIKENPQMVDENIIYFKNEIKALGDVIIIALGNMVYDILRKHLNDDYKIIKIPHYSWYIGKEKYRERVLSILNNQ